MSFSSLKKSTLSDKPRLVSVDQFIDDAVAYANGANVKQQNSKILQFINHGQDNEKMRRSTFTLNTVTIDALAEISERTGIAKSRIVRILVQNHLRNLDDSVLLDSKLK